MFVWPGRHTAEVCEKGDNSKSRSLQRQEEEEET